MREIKFRVFDKAGKIMYFPTDENDYMLLIGDSGYFSVQYHANYNINTDKYKDLSVADSAEFEIILMQFTGFSDNYRKDIYHHDLLKSGQGNIFEVVWHEEDCYWFLNCLTGNHQGPCELKRYMEENLEVIGNIYSNPELLTPVK